MEKQVRLNYQEYQNLLAKLDKAEKYIKELETKDTIIILEQDSRTWSTNYYGRPDVQVEYSKVTKGVQEVSDKLKELEEALLDSIAITQKAAKDYGSKKREYSDKLEKLESNWVYSLFYSKNKVN